jgi:type IV pilus assembly protein PilB
VSDLETTEALPPLAKLLVSSGRVSEEQMAAAVQDHLTTGRSLGRVLTELGLLGEADLVRAMANQLGLEFVDLNDYSIDRSVTMLVPEAIARRHNVLPLGWTDDRPIVAVANPSDVFAIDDLRTIMGRDLTIVVATKSQINEYIDRVYKLDQEANSVAETAAQETIDVDDEELANLHTVVEEAPIVKYVNLIILQALNDRASDIHMEPTADDLRIRFRIDGVLHDITRAPRSIKAGVISRLKVMADMNIAEHRVPQDGRVSLKASHRDIDLRVATLPTVHGEKIVMRILDKSNALMKLSDLGFLDDSLARYESSYSKPYGTILVTGPTGSGKSTTLYATLNILNSPERNLITVEDPVEYQIPGINQVQVNSRAGLTFATALRSILRSDPDILLIGEVRDRETAVIAIEAALTGHLVLTTLHTNDAAGTPMRLIEMGVEPFLVTSALDCVLAQRLARELCRRCREPYIPDMEELHVAGWDDDEPVAVDAQFYRAVGCQSCGRTGYRGRLAIHEVMVVTEEIERMIIARAPSEEIKRMSIEQGMRTLRQDGMRKAEMGMTTLEEVLRVVT